MTTPHNHLILNSPTFFLSSPRNTNSTTFSTLQWKPSLLPTRRGNTIITAAKFNLSELLGGRGLCNGEEGIIKELTSNPTSTTPESQQQLPTPSPSPAEVPEDAFEKELFGLTGGFPGGERGLQTFIEKNPPPPKGIAGQGELRLEFTGSKPKPPELPLFLPGMIVIVKNPENPYYMYCGIVQRVTDGKAGVLFEGGNWDKLLTFDLADLERREKGPPMVNPKSAILESIVENQK